MRTIYYNGVVYTGQMPLQQAFLVEENKFILVGTDEAVLKQPAEKRVDLKGHFVCAGFNDSHMHLLNYGQVLTIAPLNKHTSSLKEMLRCLEQAEPGRGGWILGRGWNQDYFSDVNRMPNRFDLDCVSKEYPICAVRACGHALVVNSKALELLHITADTQQIDGGKIVMEDGEPNGIFFDNAMDFILSNIPNPSKEDVKQMILEACKVMNAYGITSCQSDDYCAFQNLPWQIVNDAYKELEKEGALSVRVYEQANFTKINELAAFIENGNKTGTGTEYFCIGPLKLLGDGALGARTAYLSTPYKDEPSAVGLSVFSQESFDELIGYANEHGMQVAVHCIGDACLDLVLNSIEKALAVCPRTNHRHGIVHCQITRAEQLDRIAKNNLHIYAQSIFLDYDIHIVEKRVGKMLADTSYSWKSLMEKGVTVSNGSDCPVELPNVMAGVQCSVTRCDLKGEGPYLLKEAFSVQEAIDSFTKIGAMASFEECIKGQIAEGMLADFVVLGENPFATEFFKIKDIPILQTFVGGKCVFSI